MPTKVSSYLTALGFKQIDTIANASSYNKDTAGEYIVVTALNRFYRYSANCTETVDNITILNTSDGGNTRWVGVGGSSSKQERVQYTFETAGNTVPLGLTVADKAEILYVNINNTQILSSEYSLNTAMDTLILNQTFEAGVKVEVVIFSGSTYEEQTRDYSILPQTLYQHALDINSSTFTLQKEFTIYRMTVASDTTFNFKMPEDYASSYGIVTFELVVNMTVASNVHWTPTINWNNGSEPLFNEKKTFLLSFRTFDAGTSWIGNLEMEW